MVATQFQLKMRLNVEDKQQREKPSLSQGETILTVDDNPVTESPIPASKRTIMVVNKHPEMVEIVRTMLEENGFNVRRAYSGKDLLAALEKQKPDLIFLDIMMPQMDGFEVLRRLKENQATASIPVIFLTAKVQYEDVLGGYKARADYYITMPFTESQLINGINLVGWESKYKTETQLMLGNNLVGQDSDYEQPASFEEETTETATAAAEESKHSPWIYLSVIAFLSPLFAFLLVAFLHDIGNSVDIRSVIPALALISWIYSMSQRDKRHS